jgi:hypothetical protein
VLTGRVRPLLSYNRLQCQPGSGRTRVWIRAKLGRAVAGVDTVEHASLADEEAFALAKQHGTYFSMDIYDDDYILAEGETNGVLRESLEKERMLGLKQRQTFRAALKAGVKMAFGTMCCSPRWPAGSCGKDDKSLGVSSNVLNPKRVRFQALS